MVVYLRAFAVSLPLLTPEFTNPLQYSQPVKNAALPFIRQCCIFVGLCFIRSQNGKAFLGISGLGFAVNRDETKGHGEPLLPLKIIQ